MWQKEVFMRRISALPMILALTATAPAMAQVTYGGKEFVTATTAACSTSTETVERPGDVANLIYRPAVAGVQAGPDSLAILTDTRALHIQPASSTGSLNGTGTYHAVKISSDAVLLNYGGDYSFTVTQVATDIVTISGTIDNAWDLKGCNVTFQSVLGLRPAD
jgi:hypothetical protein